MAESRTQITVALIGVTGVIATAMIANGDKWFHSAPQKAPVEQASSAQPSDRAFGGPKPVATSLPKIDGWWHDTDGNRFAFIQNGARYSFIQYNGTAQVGTGSGVLTGHQFTHTFHVDDFGDGTCAGSVSSDGLTTAGHCSAAGHGEWDFRVTPGYQ